jgi:hypothetical protein
MKNKKLIFCIIGVFFFIQSIIAQTWTTTKRLTWTPSWSYNPEIAKDSKDNLYVVWSDHTPGPDEIFYKKSTDGGMTWVTRRLTWTQGYSYVPDIAIDTSDNIHVAWHDSSNFTSGKYEIFYKKSTDGGSTWLPTKRLTWNAGYSHNPAVATDSSDDIHVVWNDDTPGTYEIYHKKSTDGGNTWSGAKRLTWLSGYSIYPNVCTDHSDNLHVVWHDDTHGDWEIYYKKSTDGGSTWTTKRLTWNAGTSMRSAIATDSNSYLHVVWYDTTSGSQGINYKRSTNAGVTWEINKVIWNGLRADIAVSSLDNIYVALQSGDDIYYQKSTNNGLDWTAAKRLTWNSGDSRYPRIIADSGEDIHIVWDDDSPGNFEIYYKKGIQ